MLEKALHGGHESEHGTFFTSFHHWLAPVISEPEFQHGSLGGEIAIALVIQVLIAAMIFTAWTFYVKRPQELPAKAAGIGGGALHKLIFNKYYVDEIYDQFIVTPIVGVSRWGLFKVVDRAIIDGIVNGMGTFAQGVGYGLGRLQSGNVQVFALSIVVGLAAILSYLAMV